MNYCYFYEIFDYYELFLRLLKNFYSLLLCTKLDWLFIEVHPSVVDIFFFRETSKSQWICLLFILAHYIETLNQNFSELEKIRVYSINALL